MLQMLKTPEDDICAELLSNTVLPYRIDSATDRVSGIGANALINEINMVETLCACSVFHFAPAQADKQYNPAKSDRSKVIDLSCRQVKHQCNRS